MKFAFAGNPNSGKTTMFNAMTGKNEKVGNWAGVTVDRNEAPVKKIYSGDEEIVAVDLPGAYSMSPFTSEESITSTYIQEESPDVIINIVDATNLSRSLFFTTQLLELGIPVVVALNKTDINEKKKTHIDIARLSRALLCPVVETVSTVGDGMEEVVKAAVSRIGQGQEAPFAQNLTDLKDKEAAKKADRERFSFVNKVVAKVENRRVRTGDRNGQDQIDAILTHPVVGLPIFAVVMFLVFQISQAWLGTWLAEGYVFQNGKEIPGLVTVIDTFKLWMIGLLENASVHPFLNALLTEGIIGGVSAVVGFLPLVMVMYFLIALLEDCGYMARATVVLDPIFKKVGLSGKSVIPFVVGTGCAVPGVMACRTIRNERERRATAMLAPFMPCGAKLPVISLFAGAFFGGASWVGTLMYFAGIFIILVGALLINRITGSKHRKSYFIMELPEYKLPSIKRAALSMVQRGWSYIVKAGTVILLCNAVVYIMQSFNWRLQLVEEGMVHTSILATIAQPVAVLLKPVTGSADWRLSAAAVAGFVAKENVVGILEVAGGIDSMITTRVVALAYMIFNLFSPPCFAALGAMKAELENKKWFWGGVGLQIGTGYTAGYLVYQIGTLITTGKPGAGFLPGLMLVAVFVAVLVFLCRQGDKKVQKEYVFSGKR